MFDFEAVNRNVQPIFIDGADNTGHPSASVVLLANDIPPAQFRGRAERLIGKVKHKKIL